MLMSWRRTSALRCGAGVIVTRCRPDGRCVQTRRRLPRRLLPVTYERVPRRPARVSIPALCPPSAPEGPHHSQCSRRHPEDPLHCFAPRRLHGTVDCDHCEAII